MFTKEEPNSLSSMNPQMNTISSPDMNQQANISAPSSPDVQQLPFSDPSTALMQAPDPQDQQVTTRPSAPQPQRTPVLVPSTGKKSPGTMRPPKGRRVVIHVGTAIMLVLVLVGVSVAVLQTGDGHAKGLLGVFYPQVSTSTQQNKQTALIASQAATATAVMQDGYDAGGDMVYAGVNRDYTLDNGQSTLDIASGGAQAPSTAAAGGTVSEADLVIRATPGQCTYWADYRYWQLTGYEVPWAGNADTYNDQAPSYGWIVSYTPVLHSIIVLEGGVQGAGPATGHVGIVESINPDGTVHVSSWNIVGPGILSYTDYTPGPGVSFVYHP